MGLARKEVKSRAAGVAPPVTGARAEVPGLKAATIRTLLRIVDGLFSYLVAFITVLITEKRQRLGDMTAITLVVRK